MNLSDPLETLLPQLREPAPADFAGRVLAALPAPRRRFRWWPEGGAWLAPALAGAMAALLLVLMLPNRAAPNAPTRRIQFSLHAADAREVQLVGSFTNWETGRIHLVGPDATGHWSVELEIPEGRHEYGFLVDGHLWVADPSTPLRREDGFGRYNSILEI